MRPSLYLTSDTPRVHRDDPITSHEAADSNGTRVTVQHAVLSLLRDFGPLTDRQLAQLYRGSGGMPPCEPDSIRKRRSDLTTAGDVVPAGTIRQPNGRRATIWAVPKPSQAAA